MEEKIKPHLYDIDFKSHEDVFLSKKDNFS